MFRSKNADPVGGGGPWERKRRRKQEPSKKKRWKILPARKTKEKKKKNLVNAPRGRRHKYTGEQRKVIKILRDRIEKGPVGEAFSGRRQNQTPGERLSACGTGGSASGEKSWKCGKPPLKGRKKYCKDYGGLETTFKLGKKKFGKATRSICQNGGSGELSVGAPGDGTPCPKLTHRPSEN